MLILHFYLVVPKCSLEDLIFSYFFPTRSLFMWVQTSQKFMEHRAWNLGLQITTYFSHLILNEDLRFLFCMAGNNVAWLILQGYLVLILNSWSFKSWPLSWMALLLVLMRIGFGPGQQILKGVCCLFDFLLILGACNKNICISNRNFMSNVCLAPSIFSLDLSGTAQFN